jgi:hypothetical protein
MDEVLAVEILREFGASELVGKLYSRQVGGGTWTAMRFSDIRLLPWYKTFEKTPEFLAFDVDLSGPWRVLDIRRESDDQGPYIAAALRRFEQVPQWVISLRKHMREQKQQG